MAAAGSDLEKQTASTQKACTFVGALCIGIEEYSSKDLLNLPKARRDAEQFSRALISKGLAENSLHLHVGEVCHSTLLAAIRDFLRMVEKHYSECPGTEPQLIVICVASHGRQPDSCELPTVLASDAASPQSDVGSVDLDSQILRPLDSLTARKTKGRLKVLLVIDTCRENPQIGTYTGNAETLMKRSRWRSKTDFQMVLACDRGRLASEEPSLTEALIRELECPDKDVVAVISSDLAEPAVRAALFLIALVGVVDGVADWLFLR